MFIPERHDYLYEFLAELSAPARSATILDWHIAGSVYLEYINISNSMKQLSKVHKFIAYYAFFQ
jgi:hypothetical protein